MQLDLAALSGPELRQMLDSARGRGQAAQSYEILQEMARRRQDDRPRKRRPPGRSAEPRIITLDLGDPLDREPEFDEASTERPLHLGRAPSPAPPPAPRKPTPRRLPWLGAGLVMGAVAGIALGIQMGPERLGLAAPVEPVVREAPPAPVDVAQAAPAPPPLAPAELAIEVAETAPVEAPAAQVLPVVEETPPPSPEIVVAEAKADPPPCPTDAAPADRAICESPDLRGLQRKLQTAYADALSAHADRTLLRERQLAWRDDRSEVSDPDRLAELYKARIRKLNAATAEARRLRTG